MGSSNVAGSNDEDDLQESLLSGNTNAQCRFPEKYSRAKHASCAMLFIAIAGLNGVPYFHANQDGIDHAIDFAINVFKLDLFFPLMKKHEDVFELASGVSGGLINTTMALYYLRGLHKQLFSSNKESTSVEILGGVEVLPRSESKRRYVVEFFKKIPPVFFAALASAWLFFLGTRNEKNAFSYLNSAAAALVMMAQVFPEFDSLSRLFKESKYLKKLFCMKKKDEKEKALTLVKLRLETSGEVEFNGHKTSLALLKTALEGKKYTDHAGCEFFFKVGSLDLTGFSLFLAIKAASIIGGEVRALDPKESQGLYHNLFLIFMFFSEVALGVVLFSSIADNLRSFLPLQDEEVMLNEAFKEVKQKSLIGPSCTLKVIKFLAKLLCLIVGALGALTGVSILFGTIKNSGQPVDQCLYGLIQNATYICENVSQDKLDSRRQDVAVQILVVTSVVWMFNVFATFGLIDLACRSCSDRPKVESDDQGEPARLSSQLTF